MILVDASVVIDLMRTGDAKLLHLTKTLPVALCGITRAEVLHGIRSPKAHSDAMLTFTGFQTVMIGDDVWNSIGDNLAL